MEPEPASAPAEDMNAGPRDVWEDGMVPRSTKDMHVKEVREMDPSRTSIFTQGVLVRDGMAPAAADDDAGEPRGPELEGNGLNDLLKWSIGHASGADLASLRERVARGEYDPTAYREFLDAMMGEGDLAKMRGRLKVLVDEASDSDARVAALEEVEFLAESIDNANDLLKVGGLKTVIDCLGRPDVAVARAAANVIAVCCQNNLKCQTAALGANLVHTLLAGLIGDDERQKALTASFLYALSASVRGHPPSTRVLVDAGGVTLLSQVAVSADDKSRRKALFLLAMLAAEAPGFARAVREVGDAQAVLSALEHVDAELQAQALSLVYNTLQADAVEGAERKAGREWWVAKGLPLALQDLAQRLLLRLANGEKSEDDDPAVPLRVAKLLAFLTGAEPLGEPPLPPAPKPTAQLDAVGEGAEEEEAAQPAARQPAGAPPPTMMLC